jgi:small-conductance mechanosensitive channel
MTLLDTTFLGNPLSAWGVAAALWLGLTIVLVFARRLIRSRLRYLTQRTRNDLDDLVTSLIGHTRWWFLGAESIVAASFTLALDPSATHAVGVVAVLALLFQSGVWVTEVLDYIIRTRLRQEAAEGDASGTMSVRAVGIVGRIALWVVVVLLALQNAGIEVTALVASLGIGGVAVALALQNILGDLFASLAIVLDKPFVIGDFIVVDDFLGSVERIGLKTTRLRSLSGEEISISNSDLLKSRIRNYKRMAERRVVFGFGVMYETPVESLAHIGEWVRQIIEAQANTRFDRAHFITFGDSALTFEVVYYVLSSDFNTYMDIQQAVNLALMKRLQSEGVEFAYPTRVVHLIKREALGPGSSA